VLALENTEAELISKPSNTIAATTAITITAAALINMAFIRASFHRATPTARPAISLFYGNGPSRQVGRGQITEELMNEDVFNMEVRKFLKKVGVTSQREIEQAVRAAIESGKLAGNETVKAKVVLSIDGLDISYQIDGDIALA
jgi:hypothetical protein